MTSTPHPPPSDRPAARRGLEGLALGDAFGERWFPLFRDRTQAYEEIRARCTRRRLGHPRRQLFQLSSYGSCGVGTGLASVMSRNGMRPSLTGSLVCLAV